MIKKLEEKEKAISLRKEGKTYTEILEVIPVAKSTLSLWFKEVGMAKAQKQIFTLAKKLSAQRGGSAKRKQRIEKQAKIRLKSKLDISHISERDLFLIGIILYWAEGAKEKEHSPGSLFQFSNMDPNMIQVLLVWLFKVCKIKKNMLIFNIFLHETHKNRVDEVREYWSKVTGFPVSSFSSVYWKKNKLKTNRKNINGKYHGVLKVKVRRSSELVRKVAGWSEGIFEKVIKK